MITSYSVEQMHEVVKGAVNGRSFDDLQILPSGLAVYARPMTETSPKGISNRKGFMVDTGMRNVTRDGRLVMADNPEGRRVRVLHLPMLGDDSRSALPQEGWYANQETNPGQEGWVRPIARCVLRIAASDALGHDGSSGEKDAINAGVKGNLGPLANRLLAKATNETPQISDDEAVQHLVGLAGGIAPELAEAELTSAQDIVTSVAEGFDGLG